MQGEFDPDIRIKWLAEAGPTGFNDLNHWRIKLSLFINYFVFAILLNSVGTLILQVQHTYLVSESEASLLEAFKDLSIALTSFVVAGFIARAGYRRSMLFALAAVGTMCLLMPHIPAFWMTKLMFAITGASFALIKVSTFATLALVTSSKKEHASLMNFLEAVFMLGVLSGYFVFSAFVNDDNPGAAGWLKVYNVLAGVCVAALVLLATARLDESRVTPASSESLSAGFGIMAALCIRPLVFVFVLSIFLYVLIEQGIMSWLPTFNNTILNLPASLSIEMAAILAGSIALGRFVAGLVLRKVDWLPVVFTGLILAALLVLICLPLARHAGSTHVTSWFNAPLAAFVFPLIGFCIAPIYPAINSVMLSTLPVQQHAPMTGLIVVFSALGGTTGSLITGTLFEAFGGKTAFYLSLVPISALLITLHAFRRTVDAPAQAA